MEYGQYARAIPYALATIKSHLSEEMLTTMEQDDQWNEAVAFGDLVRTWYLLTEATLFHTQTRSTFVDGLIAALRSSNEYKLEHCGNWSVFTSRWLTARRLLLIADPHISESILVHHLTGALSADPIYSVVRMQLRQTDNQFVTSPPGVILARNSVVTALNLIGQARTTALSFESGKHAVYCTSSGRATSTPAPPAQLETRLLAIEAATAATKILITGLGMNRDKNFCKFFSTANKCKFGDACSKMHGKDDPRFVQGKLKPQYAAAVAASLEASKAAWAKRNPNALGPSNA